MRVEGPGGSQTPLAAKGQTPEKAAVQPQKQDADKVEISKGAAQKAEEPKYSESQLMGMINFKEPSEKDIELFRELVKVRARSGYFGGGAPSGAQPGVESELAIAKRMAGRSFK